MPDHFLNYLYRERARLKYDLAQEVRSIRPDPLRIARIKKLKLALKDQITRVRLGL